MSEPNPVLIWDCVNAYQRTAALEAAVNLKVFGALGQQGATAAEIAARCQASERGIRILCDYLAVVGLIGKDGERYHHSPTSAVFLDPNSPASWARALRFLNTPRMLDGFRKLTTVVQTGTTALDHAIAGEEVGEWVEFARSMAPLSVPSAQFMAEAGTRDGSPRRILDVASSHGNFGLAFARRLPDVEIFALDFPSVLEVTRENATAAGAAGRYHFIPGSAFTVDLGSGYDIILVTNLLHHFSKADCIRLLKRFREAAAPGGKVFILEFVPNEDRVSPPPAAMFSMIMLGNTVEGDAYTMREYREMLDAAGYGAHEMLDVPHAPQRLIIAHC